ncbi:hypothetical protein NC651_028216 [Populus alba x Populus x berolinensis]|nr:hypothetical protein NC651_028216 [Populus alba x Populus x berolinensis]
MDAPVHQRPKILFAIFSVGKTKKKKHRIYSLKAWSAISAQNSPCHNQQAVEGELKEIRDREKGRGGLRGEMRSKEKRREKREKAERLDSGEKDHPHQRAECGTSKNPCGIGLGNFFVSPRFALIGSLESPPSISLKATRKPECTGLIRDSQSPPSNSLRATRKPDVLVLSEIAGKGLVVVREGISTPNAPYLSPLVTGLDSAQPHGLGWCSGPKEEKIWTQPNRMGWADVPARRTVAARGSTRRRHQKKNPTAGGPDRLLPLFFPRRRRPADQAKNTPFRYSAIFLPADLVVVEGVLEAVAADLWTALLRAAAGETTGGGELDGVDGPEEEETLLRGGRGRRRRNLGRRLKKGGSAAEKMKMAKGDDGEMGKRLWLLASQPGKRKMEKIFRGEAGGLFFGRPAHTFTLVYFHGRPAHTYSKWSIFRGDRPTHSHWSTFTGDLPTYTHSGLFSRATDPYSHTGLFSGATCPHILTLVYFQGRPAHTLTLGRPAHTYSLWSIFKGDLPTLSHWSVFRGDLPTHTHSGLFSGATDPHSYTGLFSRATFPFDWVYLRSHLAI